MVATQPRTAKTSKSSTGNVVLLVGTKKGGFILRGNSSRRAWTLSDPILLGSTVHHFVLDPRDGRTMLMAAVTGHLGPTVFRSTDAGKTWKEASRPPAFKKASEGEAGLSVKHVFWLTPGHASEPNVWYAGSSPQGLFRSDDGGVTWEGVAGFNENPMRETWTGGAQDGTPDGPKMHSILIDPRDKRHLYIGMSSGGIFESTDEGTSWAPLNKGCDFPYPIPGPLPEFGHDPHRAMLHPLMPDLLYQQNHAGIYRMERKDAQWTRIGKNMPPEVGDIGFPIVLRPRDPKTVWVFHMDGTDVWPRTSPGGKPAVYVTNDGGETWRRQANGLPKANAWWTVLRQAMTCDSRDPLGLYLGTTTGQLWGSTDEGGSWRLIAEHLPHIYAIEAVEPR
ncbi:MAG: glycosyl hydrolase [SAR202 cluster bacterium]|nr:glycosyl hydrolase [SAR202 cluster bacterium]